MAPSSRITQLFKLWNRLPACLHLGQPPHIVYSIYTATCLCRFRSMACNILRRIQ